tara:strand:+ start:393 stop:1592 length:1200 start_codon:yes stop_codon:yes gene_type:complete
MLKTENIIIGAGLAGLACAKILHDSKRDYILIEKENEVGGRVKSLLMGDYIFDVGFQVYNTNYRSASKILDLDRLDLKYFKPGAYIYSNNKFNRISDPMRDFSDIKNALLFKDATLLDKIKTLWLKVKLYGDPNRFFDDDDMTTYQYLTNFGFSDNYIKKFFKPFFGGIFLERELETSSNFFKFVFSNLSYGNVSIPLKGMGEIPNQIFKSLNPGSTFLGTEVKNIENKIVSTNSGLNIQSKNIVIANDSQFDIEYNSVNCFYFSTSNDIVGDGYIHLFPGNSIINNIVNLTAISKRYSPEDKNLLSITMIDDLSPDVDIINILKNELSNIYHIDKNKFRYEKSFSIPKAQVTQKKNYFKNRESKDDDFIYAGDYLTNSSIDGAIKSGLDAARQILSGK